MAVIVLTISIGIGAYFVYKYMNHWYLKKDVTRIEFGTLTLMGQVKEINIKNQTYYFFNDMINIKNVQSSLLKIYKKSYKDIDIY